MGRGVKPCQADVRFSGNLPISALLKPWIAPTGDQFVGTAGSSSGFFMTAKG